MWPIDAFTMRPAGALNPGDLFQMRGHWALCVEDASNTKYRAALMLEGEASGLVFPLQRLQDHVTAIADPYSWSALTGSLEGDATHIGAPSLRLTLEGPVVSGVDPHARPWDPPLLFTLDGRHRPGVRTTAPAGTAWAVHLRRADDARGWVELFRVTPAPSEAK